MLKKRFFSMAIAIVMIVAISTVSTVYAYDFEFKEEKKQIINNEIDVSDFITYYEMNNEYKSSINQQKLEFMKNHLDTDKISKEELYTEVFRGLGYSDEEINAIGMEEISYIMETSIEITMNEQYVMVDEEGNCEVVSKEECLSEAEKINLENKVQRKNQLEVASQSIISPIQNEQFSSKNNTMVAATASNDSLNSEIKGAMKITTRSDYIKPSTINNEKGWYNFSSTFVWLTTPDKSWTDAFSLYAVGCAWSQGTSDIYSRMTYTEVYKYWPNIGSSPKITKTPKTVEKYTKDRKVQSEGVYYTYELPQKTTNMGFIPLPPIWWSSETSFENLIFYIRAKARVSNQNANYNFNVFSRYEHLTKDFSVNKAFVWRVGSSFPGVTVTTKVETNHTAYESYNYTSYNPSIFK